MKYKVKVLSLLACLFCVPALTGQTVGDQQAQVGVAVAASTTPSTSSSYSWQEIANNIQGVNVNVKPTEVQPIYLQKDNSRINFNVYNTSNLMTRLEVKYGSGSWDVVFSNQSEVDSGWLVPEVSGLGKHTVHVKWTSLGGNNYNRSYDIYVVETAVELHQDNFGNTILRWGEGSLHDPLVISEGFDAYNRHFPEYYRDAGKVFFDEFIQEDGSIYVVNYEYNSQDLRNSAAIFDSAVRYISTINADRNVVAAGLSMGGVIARYALANAEDMGAPLPVNKFISMDSPQQGANISLQMQNVIKDPPSWCSSGNPYQKFALKSKAARQMLYKSAWTSLHDVFYDELRSLNNGVGYPSLARNIGVAFSDSTPNPHGGIWLSVAFEGVFGVGICSFYEDIILTSTDKLAGSYLSLDSTSSDPRQMYWGWLSIERHKDAVFIPYVSALDITDGVTPFDAVIESAAARYHDELPSDVVQDLLEELGIEPAPLSAWIKGPTLLEPSELGIWFASSSGGSSPYTYRWDYRLLCSGFGRESLVGVEEPLEVACGYWNYGGNDYVFSRSVSGDATIQLKLTLTDSDNASRTIYKTVRIGDGGFF